MSLILVLETATEQCSVALVENDLLLCEVCVHHGRDLSRLLMPAVRNCMDLAQQPLAAIDAVACSVGPGSFTGLRIGVTAAKTLAYALNVPAIAVPTLEVLAASVSTYENDIILAAIDARRSEFFAAVFMRTASGLERILSDSLVPKAELAHFFQADARLKADPESSRHVIVTPPAIIGALRDVVRETFRVECIPAFPRAGAAAFLGRGALTRGELVVPVELVPSYLRRSYAEEKSEGGTR